MQKYKSKGTYEKGKSSNNFHILRKLSGFLIYEAMSSATEVAFLAVSKQVGQNE
jgi:hypothetical protein